MKLSIVICTHNRSDLLKKCIDSVISQDTSETEIIIIDNNSNDETATFVQEYSNQNIHLKHIIELRIGLSYARNRGIEESSSNWIMFIDDDAICHNDTISKALESIKLNQEFGIIGGIYLAYHQMEKPNWMPKSFGTNDIGLKYYKEVFISDSYLPSGGIFLVKKEIFQVVTKFNVDLGMQGKKELYGEETDLIIRALQSKIRVGMDPHIKVDHLIQEIKHSVWWHIKSKYRSTISYYMISKKSLIHPLIYFFKGNIATLLKRIPKLIFSEEYYWQNFVIESTYPFTILTGAIYGRLRK